MLLFVSFLVISQRYLDNSLWPLILTNYENFALRDIPDMSEKVVLVTGANTGLGYASSLELARKGAQVIMGCRSEKRAREAMESILQEVETAKLDFVPLDLGDFRSTDNAIVLIKQKYKRLDVVMANAGVQDLNYLRLDGMERPMRINHLGHFQLVTGLEELILAATNPRVVFVTSGAHRLGGDLFDESWYKVAKKSESRFILNKIFLTYGRSKLANILFARELQSQFDQRNESVYVNSAHPGTVATRMSQRFAKDAQNRTPSAWTKVFGALGRAYLSSKFTPEDGALAQLYLASSPEVVEKSFKGEYFVPHGVRTDPDPSAKNLTKQRELWEWSKNELERLSRES